MTERVEDGPDSRDAVSRPLAWRGASRRCGRVPGPRAVRGRPAERARLGTCDRSRRGPCRRGQQLARRPVLVTRQPAAARRVAPCGRGTAACRRSQRVRRGGRPRGHRRTSLRFPPAGRPALGRAVALRPRGALQSAARSHSRCSRTWRCSAFAIPSPLGHAARRRSSPSGRYSPCAAGAVGVPVAEMGLRHCRFRRARIPRPRGAAQEPRAHERTLAQARRRDRRPQCGRRPRGGSVQGLARSAAIGLGPDAGPTALALLIGLNFLLGLVSLLAVFVAFNSLVLAAYCGAYPQLPTPLDWRRGKLGRSVDGRRASSRSPPPRWG